MLYPLCLSPLASHPLQVQPAAHDPARGACGAVGEAAVGEGGKQVRHGVVGVASKVVSLKGWITSRPCCDLVDLTRPGTIFPLKTSKVGSFYVWPLFCWFCPCKGLEAERHFFLAKLRDLTKPC